MTITMQQIEACRLVATGLRDKDVWPIVGVSEATFYRWKSRKTFKECLSFFHKEELKKATAIAASANDPGELIQAREDELLLRTDLVKIASNLCRLASKATEDALESEEPLGIRVVPSIIKAATDAIACLRSGNDRLSGLESLLDELGQIDKEIRAKGIEFAASQKDTTAQRAG